MNLADLNDGELMRLYGKEDRSDAFAEIYRRYHRKVMGFLTKKLNDTTAASEVFQDVFLKFHANRMDYNHSIPLSAWIFMISRNAIVDYYRKNKRYKNEVPMEGEYVESDEHPSLDLNLESLTPDEKKLIDQKFFQGKDYKELAKEFSTKDSTLRKRLSRIIEKIRLSNKRN